MGLPRHGHPGQVSVRGLDVTPDGGVWVVGSDGYVYRMDPSVALPAQG